ncbi:MAG: hypothetical protein WD467_00295 [Candidatus Saccharimonadales bacterium]
MSEKLSSRHTEAALISELDHIYGLPQEGLRIFGSIGRSALYGTIYNDSSREFTVRREHPLGTINRPRDIDLLGLSAAEAEGHSPFPVDATGMKDGYAALTRDRNDWYLLATHHGFAEQLHPDVMEPIAAQGLYGAAILTVPLQTHLGMHGITGLRKRDVLTRDLMLEAHRDLNLAEQKRDELYAPFIKLAHLNSRVTYLTLRNAYRRYIPNSVRLKAVPIMRVIKGILQ